MYEIQDSSTLKLCRYLAPVGTITAAGGRESVVAETLLPWSSGGSERVEYQSAVSCIPLNSNSFAFRSCPCKASISFFRWRKFDSNALCIGFMDDMDAETLGKTFGCGELLRPFFAVSVPLCADLAFFSDDLCECDALLDIS